MNYLELCQSVRQQAGISGTGPVDVTTQTGVYQKIVDWVAQAYLDIQTEETRWRWLWVEEQFNTVLDQRDYAPVADLGLTNFNAWEIHSLYARRSSSGQRFPLEYSEYEHFRDYYLQTTNGPAQEYTFLPNKTLRFQELPNVVEAIDFEYWRTPYELVDADDVPAFPSHHHKIIVYKALMYYAADEEAGNIFSDASSNYTRFLSRLRGTELMQPYMRLSTLA